MAKRLRYFYEYTPHCLWADNEDAHDQFGYGIANKKLPLSEKTIELLDSLGDEFHGCLNWDDPTGPSPWTKEHDIDFYNRALEAYNILVKELGDEYEVINELNKFGLVDMNPPSC